MSLTHAIDLYDPQQLDALTKEQLESLPCGTIRVDEDGIILFYSRTQGALTQRQPAAVLGRNFFTDVAPCTIVPEFYGRFRQGVLTGDLNASFEFVFDFDMEPVQVKITMRTSERPGEFWMLVEPVQHLPGHDAHAAERLIADKYGEHPVVLSSASFDFSHCDQEPIATCATIQPFGTLLVIDPESLRILACGANTPMYLGLEPEVLLDEPLTALLPQDDSGLLEALSAPETLRFLTPSQFCLTRPNSDLSLHVQVHRWRDHLLLDIEPHGEMAMDLRMRGFDFAAFQRELRSRDDPAAICQIGVEALRRITDFQRVLAYRFEPNDDGIVIAESIAGDTWPSVLGLRYPATDIPRQARALYCETPLRYTPSRDHADIALLSRRLDPTHIDIGIAQVRAPSPIHRNYHKRFEVNASMSLSIMHDQRLWGLLIFHHHAPHPVTPYVRQRLIEITGCLSGRVSLLEDRARNQAREQGMAEVNAIVGEIDIEKPFPDSLLGKEDLLCRLVGADMVQIYHRREALFIAQDRGLSSDQQQTLLTFLRTRAESIWSTDCLSAEFEPAAAYPDRLAGVLVVFIDEQRNDCLIFGRKRLKYTVDWGAEPGSLPFADDTQVRPLGWPNRTFQRWREERTHHARSWSLTEVATAEALKTLMQQVIVAHAGHFERLAQSLENQRDQLQRSREEMRHRALHDTLTGLPNRARFRESLKILIEASWRSGQRFGVALLDIDHFKTINDTLGHDHGDILLCAVAERIVEVLPPPAVVARLGGDEFALLIPQQEEGQALAQSNRLVEQLRRKIEVGEDSFSITGSLGLVIGDSEGDPGDLLKQADLALYRAKADGRNCARLFDQSLQTVALQRLEIDRAVLVRSPTLAIELVLQPQRSIRAEPSRQRFEVLSRWRTKEGELIMPGDFIPAAERNGLIRSVTEAVKRRVIRLLQACLERGAEDLVLTVNVSASDLESRHFARRLSEELHAADVPPDMLELEITESVLLRMTPNVKDSLTVLANSGVQLALDDFGTGFSSMLYLRELPISVLKIDRAFVSGVDQARDRNLVAGMIAMAHSIGKIVVAEGIETQDQLEVLDALGCDWGQGYFWSRPVAPDQALACLQG